MFYNAKTGSKIVLKTSAGAIRTAGARGSIEHYVLNLDPVESGDANGNKKKRKGINIEKKKSNGVKICAFVSPEEKKQIEKLAAACGLRLNEYLKQRCLGYAPKMQPPKLIFQIMELLGNLDVRENMYPEQKLEIRAVLAEIPKEFLLPEMEDVSGWQ